MFPGKVPHEIVCLTQFERIFIRLVNMYQHILRLDTNKGDRPHSERMQALKGFTISLKVPVQNTIDQLGDGRPGRLLNPNNSFMLLGIPNKSRKIWTKLVDINKIMTALQWLVVNNELYSDIKLPKDPYDLLPRDPSDGMNNSEVEEYLCQSNSSLSNEGNCNTASSIMTPVEPVDLNPMPPKNAQEQRDICYKCIIRRRDYERWWPVRSDSLW